MARQGNILSFNEVQGSKNKRPSVPAPKNSAEVSSAKSKRRSTEKKISSSGRFNVSSDSSEKRSKSRSNAERTTSGRQRPDVSGSVRAPKQRTESSRTSVSAKRRPDTSGSMRAVNQRPDTTGSMQEVEQRPDTSGSFKITKFAELKRNLSKSKASKEFTKQFGDTTASAATAGPRAALYKGEMGRQHKKMAKMQDTAKSTPRFSLPSFGPRSVGIVAVILGLAFSCAFLYPSAQQYYQSMRDYAQAEAEYAAVIDRNASIESQVNQLSTEDGIEDRARSEYGYVKEGEQAVTVRGLEKEAEEPVYVKSVPSGSVAAPEAWYTPLLDTIFGVE